MELTQRDQVRGRRAGGFAIPKRVFAWIVSTGGRRQDLYCQTTDWSNRCRRFHRGCQYSYRVGLTLIQCSKSTEKVVEEKRGSAKS